MPHYAVLLHFSAPQRRLEVAPSTLVRGVPGQYDRSLWNPRKDEQQRVINSYSAPRAPTNVRLLFFAASRKIRNLVRGIDWSHFDEISQKSLERIKSIWFLLNFDSKVTGNEVLTLKVHKSMLHTERQMSQSERNLIHRSVFYEKNTIRDGGSTAL